MKNDDCIFCKIANGEIPTRTVYEDDDFCAIMDFKPATKGHILLLPKQHADDLFGLPEDIASKVLPTAKKIALKMQKNLQFDGMNLVQNNGEIAGQTILHFHLHMIPRYINDGQKIAWVPTSPEDAELDRIKDQIVG